MAVAPTCLSHPSGPLLMSVMLLQPTFVLWSTHLLEVKELCWQAQCSVINKSAISSATQTIAEEDKAKVPVGKPGQDYLGPKNYTVDVSKSKKLLGMEYRRLSETVVDAALSIVQSRAAQ